MKLYSEMIIEATGCCEADAIMVEDIMRNEIFHSTLDWQTDAQFDEGARQALDVLNLIRPEFEAFHRAGLDWIQAAKAEEAQLREQS